MKRKISIFISLALSLSLYACDNSETSGASNSNSSAEQIIVNSESVSNMPSSEVISQITSSETTNDVFEPSEDLNIIASFIYKGDTYIVVENIGEQAILNFKVAYINFDKNGFITTTDTDGYSTGKGTTVNLMPGEKSMLNWYGAKGDYAVAAITNIEYADGRTWEATNVYSWAEKATKNFDIETHKMALNGLKDIGFSAETTEYAILENYRIKHENQFSSNHDLHFSVKNTAGQGITRLNIYVLEFDDNGFPVNVSPYDTYCINGHPTGGTVNLAIGQTGSYSDDLFLSPTTSQIKAIISFIEFQDGTEWTNPYVFEWIIGNNKSYT